MVHELYLLLLFEIQGAQLNMAVFFWYLVKSKLSSLSYVRPHVHWISPFLQGKKTNGHV